MSKKIIFYYFMLFMVNACGPAENEQPQVVSIDSSKELAEASSKNKPSDLSAAFDVSKDYHSFSNPDEVIVKHIALDLSVDFDRKVMHGTAAIDYKKVDPAATILVLDTNDLDIKKVSSGDQELPFKLQSSDSFLGAALEITLPKNNARLVIDLSLIHI